MQIYVDTNILLSQFDRTALYREENARLFEQPDITFLGSFLTILEFRAIINRLWRSHSILINEGLQPALSKLSEADQLRLIFKDCFDRFHLLIFNVCIPETVSLRPGEIKVDNNLNLAYEFTTQLPLRTLDLIHLASAMNIKLFAKIDIDYFLTNDDLVLTQAKKIHQLTHFLPISSPDLIKILQLK